MSTTSTSSPTSSLTSLFTASIMVSPTSMCPPGRVYLSNHLWDLANRIFPWLLTIRAPTVGSGKTCVIDSFEGDCRWSEEVIGGQWSRSVLSPSSRTRSEAFLFRASHLQYALERLGFR